MKCIIIHRRIRRQWRLRANERLVCAECDGFYPVTPGTPDYIIGTPLFSSATIHLENGKQFVIRARMCRPQISIYSPLHWIIKHKNSFCLIWYHKGRTAWFQHGQYAFIFGKWSLSFHFHRRRKDCVLNPRDWSRCHFFTGKKEIAITFTTKKWPCIITVDGSVPNVQSLKYTAPFSIEQSATIKAIAVNEKACRVM